MGNFLKKKVNNPARRLSLIAGLILAFLIFKNHNIGLSEPILDRSGRILGDNERARIAAVLNIPLPPETPPMESATVILHDTAWSMTTAHIEEQKRSARGPFQLGPNVYVPRRPTSDSTLESIARPFYEKYRPTSTFYEQAADLMPAETRDKLARQVWKNTPEAERNRALNDALKDVPLNNRSSAELARRTRSWLNSRDNAAFKKLTAKHPRGYFDGAKTSALWTVEEICKNSNNGTCKRLNRVFETRERRVASTVNIEIVQQPGSHCLTRGDLKSLPEYTDYQYRETMRLYLYAALLAGRYPEIQTHYGIDSFLLNQGKYPHCDPRGFDLMRLYNLISETMNQPEGSLYGIAPRYGTNPRRGDNIWWHPRVFARRPS